jgi:hypothetical protein
VTVQMEPSSDPNQRSTLAKPYRPGDTQAFLTKAIHPERVRGANIGGWHCTIRSTGPTNDVLDVDPGSGKSPETIPEGAEVIGLLWTGSD